MFPISARVAASLVVVTEEDTVFLVMWVNLNLGYVQLGVSQTRKSGCGFPQQPVICVDPTSQILIMRTLRRH